MFTSTLSKDAAAALALLGKSGNLEDIAAMEIDAICSRGTKRDFIDLYFLIKKFTPDKILKFYDKKYGKLSNNIYHILKSLNYFEDANPQVSPKMLIPVSWEEIKKFFQTEVIALTKTKLLLV